MFGFFCSCFAISFSFHFRSITPTILIPIELRPLKQNGSKLSIGLWSNAIQPHIAANVYHSNLPDSASKI
jgi:hypothetical protein